MSSRASTRCSLPLSEWPAADRARWQAALEPGDLLDDGGARARYRPASNRKTELVYGYWLMWLLRGNLLDDADPADRITPDRVARFVADERAIWASGTVLSHLQDLHCMALVIEPTRDWAWMRRIMARVRATHVPARNKRARMVAARDLWELGETLMADAPMRSTERQRASQHRDGLIIALLAARPLRLRNLAGLALGGTLVRRGAEWWIDIPGDETKTHAPIEVPWPETLGGALETYLVRHRPVLCRNPKGSPGAGLWVSSHGPAMSAHGIALMIVRRTTAAFGHPVNPHLFRDCAATSIAIEDPAHVGIASQLLGHRSAATTERYYIHARAIEAARRYQDFLVSLRQGTMTDEPDRRGSQ